jgi:preprotein translocase subunit Sec63
MGRDFYSILGVSRDAKEEDLKKAFRKVRFCMGLYDISALALDLD